MITRRVLPPDLEKWLGDFLRAALADAGYDVQVGHREPTNLRLPLSKPLVIIRDDSGSRTDWMTFDRSVGVTILAGSRDDDEEANFLARLVASILMDDTIYNVKDSPIAAVTWAGCNGPYAVAEGHDVARRYLTVEYVVVGTSGPGPDDVRRT